MIKVGSFVKVLDLPSTREYPSYAKHIGEVAKVARIEERPSGLMVTLSLGANLRRKMWAWRVKEINKQMENK